MAEGIKYMVADLPDWVEDEALHEHFSQYGQILEAVVARDKGASTSRGFGYVTMADGNSRDAILNDKHMFGEYQSSIKITKESLAQFGTFKVHVSKLGHHVEAEQLRVAFAKFGNVLDVHTPKDPNTQERKNFGFVTFDTHKAFDDCISSGTVSVGEGEAVIVKPAAESGGDPGPAPRFPKGKGGHDLGKGKDPYGYEFHGAVVPAKGGGKWVCKGGAAAPPDPWAGARPDPYHDAKGSGGGGKGGGSKAPQMFGVKYLVDHLPEELEDEDLKKYFSSYGDVVEAAIVRDRNTNASRCFAYITMADSSTQEQILNDRHSFGEDNIATIKMTKESLAEVEIKKVHLGHLSHDISAERIKEVFAEFGTVLDVHTPKDPATGVRKDFGFVTFGTHEAFKSVVSAGRIMIDDCEVVLRPANESSGIKYIIGDLPGTVTDEDLNRHFAKYGPVIEAAVVTDRDTNESRGFAYLKMSDSESRDKILGAKHRIHGVEVSIKITKESLQNVEIKKIHLKDLSVDTTSQQIRDVFAKYGTVLDVHTPKNPDTGERKNFGFVTFGTAEAFHAAIRQGFVTIGGSQVQIKPAAESSEGGGDMPRKGKGGKGKAPVQQAVVAYGGKGYAAYDPWADPYGKGYPPDPYAKGKGYAADPYGKGYAADPYGKGYAADPYAKGYAPDPYAKGFHDPYAKGKGFAEHAKGGDKGKGKDESFKIHLGNVDQSISKEEIQEAMSQFGAIADVHTPKDPNTGERRNFAFVLFTDERAYTAALNTWELNISGAIVELKPAGRSLGGKETPKGGKPAMKGYAPDPYGQEGHWELAPAPVKGGHWERAPAPALGGHWERADEYKGGKGVLAIKGAPGAHGGAYGSHRAPEYDPYGSPKGKGAYDAYGAAKGKGKRPY